MDLSHLTDEQVTLALRDIVKDERAELRPLLLHLGEFDRRRIAVPKGHQSTFHYCTAVLGYSEGAAYRRIHTSRAARAYPVILDLLEQGAIHMMAVAILFPVMTPENHIQLLQRGCGKTTLELKWIAAELAPKEAKGEAMRRMMPPTVEAPHPVDEQARLSLPTPDAIEPFAAHRVRFGFNGDEETLELVMRARNLLKHKYPFGQLEDIFKDALKALIDKKDPGRQPPTGQAVSLTRSLSRRVRRQVWERDGGQCAFEPPGGPRCQARGLLEFDHIRPWTLGGLSTADNLRLLCRAHNQAAAEGFFGSRDLPMNREGRQIS